MSVRDNIRDRPRTRRLLQVLTILFIAIIDLHGGFLVYIVWTAKNLSTFAEFVIDNLFVSFLDSVPGDILSMLVSAAPAVLAGVCYTSRGADRDLNAVGVLSAILALCGLIVGIIAAAALKAPSEGPLLIGSESTVKLLAQSAETVARTSLFYLAVFFGIDSPKYLTLIIPF